MNLITIKMIIIIICKVRIIQMDKLNGVCNKKLERKNRMKFSIINSNSKI